MNVLEKHLDEGHVMDVKAAVAQAKAEISTLFAEEGIQNLGLEEVDYDEAKSIWRITVGFSRPWDEPRSALAALAAQNPYWRRAYKVVTIDEHGTVLSVKSLDAKP